jgi:pSer/pThr/pTyr-binding forkhead associated (FHA) protein
LLFAGKWAVIGLVYFILIIVLISVRREMAYRTSRPERQVAVAAGNLKVINAGSDRRILPGKILPLKIETRLGAETDNDLILGDQYISRHHACLRWDGAVWWIEDLGSSNGTTVDGHVCPPRNPQPVKGGASLQLGDMVFELLV